MTTTDTTAYDLSRMRDRAGVITAQVEDLSLSKVNGVLDDELRRAAGAVADALQVLMQMYELRLGEPDSYVPAPEEETEQKRAAFLAGEGTLTVADVVAWYVELAPGEPLIATGPVLPDTPLMVTVQAR